jgi:hypothetical protein
VDISAGCFKISAEIFIPGKTSRATATSEIYPTDTNSIANRKFLRELAALCNDTDRLMP